MYSSPFAINETERGPEFTNQHWICQYNLKFKDIIT